MKGYSINPNKDLTLDVDDLWMHIETDQNVKILLGVIYRYPKGNISAFNDKLSAIVEKIRSKDYRNLLYKRRLQDRHITIPHAFTYRELPRHFI